MVPNAFSLLSPALYSRFCPASAASAAAAAAVACCSSRAIRPFLRLDTFLPSSSPSPPHLSSTHTLPVSKDCRLECTWLLGLVVPPVSCAPANQTHQLVGAPLDTPAGSLLPNPNIIRRPHPPAFVLGSWLRFTGATNKSAQIVHAVLQLNRGHPDRAPNVQPSSSKFSHQRQQRDQSPTRDGRQRIIAALRLYSSAALPTNH